MTHAWSKQPIPYAVEVPDRAPKERYYSQEFFDLEAEQLWSRTWQMACRLEEIPEPGDFTIYEILDQSVIVIRGEDGEIRAMHNTCRHRGVKLATAPGNCAKEFVCPFHGWCYDQSGRNTKIPMRKSFAQHNIDADDVSLAPVQCDTWGGCVWINLDPEAPPLRESIEPAASILDAWKVEDLRVEWWYACRPPVNWKLAQQAFQEMYHVVVTHPQLVIAGMRYGAQHGEFDPKRFVDAEIQYLHTMSEGMAGMVHATDVAVAESIRDIDLPADPAAAMAAWYLALNTAVVEHHRSLGHEVPDLVDLEAKGLAEPMGYVFPHYFVLPMYSSASSYRFRPVGPEETIMEIWSMTRYLSDAERPRPVPPEIWPHDDPRWPPIPAQDFSNLPRQQLGLHSKAFEFMRLSQTGEGHLSNFERVLDGFLAGLPHDRLASALREVNVNPLERHVVDIEF